MRIVLQFRQNLIPRGIPRGIPWNIDVTGWCHRMENLRPRLRGALGFPFASPAMPPIAEEPPATQRGKGRDTTRHDETRDRFSSLSPMKTDFLNFLNSFIIFHHFSSPVSCSLLFDSSKLRHRATGRSSASPIPGRVWKFVGALAWSGALAAHQIVSSNVKWMS